LNAKALRKRCLTSDWTSRTTTNPVGLHRLGKREWTKSEDEANFLDGSATPKVGKKAGVTIARKKTIPICQSIRVTITMGVDENDDLNEVEKDGEGEKDCEDENIEKMELCNRHRNEMKRKATETVYVSR
jgi:hypothetical protein